MDIFSRATELGIETEFTDGTGHHHSPDPSTLLTIVETFTPPEGRRLLRGPIIVRGEETFRADLELPLNAPVTWTLTRQGAQIASGETSEIQLNGPSGLATGLYRLHLRDAAGANDAVDVIIAPPRAFQGSFGRAWTLGVQLYALRSETSIGIGDFGDLQRLIPIAANAGAAGIGLNPLHALFGDRPADCSPYSPNSRLFLNPLYIDITSLPELPSDFLATNRADIDRLKMTDEVDYIAVADVKFRALQFAFLNFKSAAASSRSLAFEAFREERGTVLRRFAAFEALREKFQTPWWEWPPQWCAPNDEALAELATGEHADKIAFVEFVQWIADQQLRACRDLTVEHRMAVGLYLDIAVGVKADGFDAWNEQSAISRRLSVGAPPDQLNTVGQDWGLAGFSPVSLEQNSVRPFCDMLAASMRYAGAVRLDHILGLKRLYLIPSGSSPQHGVYIRMPFETLLAATALQSQEFGCVVIGEDLGTVPDGFRDQLAEAGIWSYRVMIFEREYDGAFRRAEAYAANALITFTTHDLPTYAGWMSGHDLNRKLEIGIDPGETFEQRDNAVAALRAAIGEHDAARGFYGVIAFLSRAPSRILDIALLDLLGGLEQPNIPGTIDEHPNWRQRLTVTLEKLPESIDFALLGQVLGNRTPSHAKTKRPYAPEQTP